MAAGKNTLAHEEGYKPNQRWTEEHFLGPNSLGNMAKQHDALRELAHRCP